LKKRNDHIVTFWIMLLPISQIGRTFHLRTMKMEVTGFSEKLLNVHQTS